MGLSVSEAFGDLYVQFTLSYVLVRSMMIFMYARVYTAHPQSRTISVRFMIGFAGGIAIWLAAILLPAEYHWIAWLVAILFEIVFFSLPAMVEGVRSWTPDIHHMMERYGIFTIIVLGEAFVKVLDDAQGTVLGIEQILFGIAGLGLLYGMWWLYFTDTAEKEPERDADTKILGWSYGHLFLAVSLVAFGVSAKKLFSQTIKYASDPITEEYRLLLTAAVVIFLLALAIISYGIDNKLLPHNQTTNALLYLGAAVLIGAIGWLVTTVTVTLFTTILALIMAGLVGFNIYQAASAPAHH